MFKKITKLMLIGLVLVSLSACGKSDKTNNEEHEDINSAYSIYLNFDNEYELKLDGDDKIVHSKCLDKNDDTFKEINILDKDYKDAIVEILEYVYNHSKNDLTNLTFKISGINEEFNLQHLRYNLLKLANNFAKVNKLKLSLTVDDISEDFQSYDNNGNLVMFKEFNTEYYFNLDGSIAKIYKNSDKVEETIIYENELLKE